MTAFIITLRFARPPSFTTEVTATTRQQAIAEARAWARACGYHGAVIDTRCRGSSSDG